MKISSESLRLAKWIKAEIKGKGLEESELFEIEGEANSEKTDYYPANVDKADG